MGAALRRRSQTVEELLAKLRGVVDVHLAYALKLALRVGEREVLGALWTPPPPGATKVTVNAVPVATARGAARMLRSSLELAPRMRPPRPRR